jgi:hypothetical protein
MVSNCDRKDASQGLQTLFGGWSPYQLLSMQSYVG